MSDRASRTPSDGRNQCDRTGGENLPISRTLRARRLLKPSTELTRAINGAALGLFDVYRSEFHALVHRCSPEGECPETLDVFGSADDLRWAVIPPTGETAPGKERPDRNRVHVAFLGRAIPIIVGWMLFFVIFFGGRRFLRPMKSVVSRHHGFSDECPREVYSPQCLFSGGARRVRRLASIGRSWPRKAGVGPISDPGSPALSMTPDPETLEAPGLVLG
jgi:hypothetical protein